MNYEKYHNYLVAPDSVIAATFVQFELDWKAYRKAVNDLLLELGATQANSAGNSIISVNFDEPPVKTDWIRDRGRGAPYNAYKPSRTNTAMKLRFASPELKVVGGWELQTRLTGVDNPFMYQVGGLRMSSLTMTNEGGRLILHIPKCPPPAEGERQEEGWRPTEGAELLTPAVLFRVLAEIEETKAASSNANG